VGLKLPLLPQSLSNKLKQQMVSSVAVFFIQMLLRIRSEAVFLVFSNRVGKLVCSNLCFLYFAVGAASRRAFLITFAPILLNLAMKTWRSVGRKSENRTSVTTAKNELNQLYGLEREALSGSRAGTKHVMNAHLASQYMENLPLIDLLQI
jgi:hypothetical protein